MATGDWQAMSEYREYHQHYSEKESNDVHNATWADSHVKSSKIYDRSNEENESVKRHKKMILFSPPKRGHMVKYIWVVYGTAGN